MTEVSATAVELVRSCERKWAFDRWQKAPPSAGLEAAAQGGRELHADAEGYHKLGQSPDPNTIRGRQFMAALPYLPRPRTGRAEGEFHMEVSGVPYLGFVDLDADAEHFPDSCASGIPGVLDYKSKNEIRQGDRKNVLIGAGDFLNNPQTLIYAVRSFVKYKDADAVFLRWLYIKRLEKVTSKPKVFASDAILSRKETIEAFGRIVHPAAKRIVHLAMLNEQSPIDPLTLEPSPATCLKYGPKYACPYMDRCTDVTAGQLLAASAGPQTQKPEGEIMNFLDELKAKEAQNNKTVAGVPVASSVATAPVVSVPAQAPAAAPKGINPPVAGSGSVAVDTAAKLPSTPAARVDLAQSLLAQGPVLVSDPGQKSNPQEVKVATLLRAIADLLD